MGEINCHPIHNLGEQGAELNNETNQPQQRVQLLCRIELLWTGTVNDAINGSQRARTKALSKIDYLRILYLSVKVDVNRDRSYGVKRKRATRTQAKTIQVL